MDIRNIITPFASALPNPHRIDMQGQPADSLRNISISKTHQTIYDDGRKSIVVPAWTYDNCYPGPLIEVTSGTSIQVEWQNKTNPNTDTMPVTVEVTPFGDMEQSQGIVPQNVLGLNGVDPFY